MTPIEESWRRENGMYECPHCKKQYSKMGIGTHIWRSHGDGIDFDNNIKAIKAKGSYFSWNRGLTKDTDERIKNQAQELSQKYKAGKIIPSQLGKPITEETRKKISEKMKIAHAEGRAWNIGKSRWNNEPSYPEKFFMRVIVNEGMDTDYVREYPFYKFSLDFAWPKMKKAVEIDGEQHERFEEQKRRDNEKDALLEKDGWKLYRVKWTDFFKNTQFHIEKIKIFLITDPSEIVFNQNEMRNKIQFIKPKRKKAEYIKEQKIKSCEYQKSRIDLIRSGSIDITKHGWVQEFAVQANMKPQHVRRFMKMYCPDILEKAFKRKGDIT